MLAADDPARHPPAEPFEARLQHLLDELLPAIRWGRPSILLAVYRSDLVRLEVWERLQSALAGLGQDLVAYPIQPETADLPLILRDAPGRGTQVYWVTGLSRGGGRDRAGAFRALNLHREYLVEASLRCLFWLSPAEARLLPRRAPDFWAFRHRVVEWMDFPSPGRIRRQAGERGRLLDRERELLARLERDEPALAWADWQAAAGRAASDPQAWIDLGLAGGLLGFPAEALAALRRAARLTPPDPDLQRRMAEACLDLGLVREAARLSRRAAEKR